MGEPAQPQVVTLTVGDEVIETIDHRVFGESMILVVDGVRPDLLGREVVAESATFRFDAQVAHSAVSVGTDHAPRTELTLIGSMSPRVSDERVVCANCGKSVMVDDADDWIYAATDSSSYDMCSQSCVVALIETVISLHPGQ